MLTRLIQRALTQEEVDDIIKPLTAVRRQICKLQGMILETHPDRRRTP